jgi:hypothetical protein
MFELKPLSEEGIPAALEKAERYRLLNEAREAESICLDILEIDPDNQPALVILLLSITDQFGHRMSHEVKQARGLLPRLRDAYERAYYAGIVSERQAKAILRRGAPDSHPQAYHWFRDAMDHFEQAESIRPPGNDDALLRWNTCVRLIMRYHLAPRREDYTEHFLE